MALGKQEADMSGTSTVLQDHFRCPEKFALHVAGDDLPGQPAYFTVDGDTVAYGRLRSATSAPTAPSPKLDSAPGIRLEEHGEPLPFDPAEVLENLRFERYRGVMGPAQNGNALSSLVRNAYYLVRPLLPVSVRKHLQKLHLRNWEQIPFPSWPVDCSVESLLEKLLIHAMKTHGVREIPFIWFWPEGHSSALIITHDVETSAGVEFCPTLLDIDARCGIRPAFQLIPEERYTVSPWFLKELRRAGAEVNVHDLNHDGHLYDNREEFKRRAEKINQYAAAFEARGFRSGVLYRNLDWYDALKFSYDMSVPNVAHLDPQRGGCCTVLPYFVGNILELPLTMTQDYSLFHILGEYSVELWKRQIGLVLGRHGLISFNVHPDYVIELRARRIYEQLLQHLGELRRETGIWTALPGEVDLWWRQRQRMRLVQEGTTWRIEGPGAERARVAFARLDSGQGTCRFEVTS
jgi:hypothetical protein